MSQFINFFFWSISELTTVGKYFDKYQIAGRVCAGKSSSQKLDDLWGEQKIGVIKRACVVGQQPTGVTDPPGVITRVLIKYAKKATQFRLQKGNIQYFSSDVFLMCACKTAIKILHQIGLYKRSNQMMCEKHTPNIFI